MGDGGHAKAGGKKLPEAFRYSPPQLSKYKEGHYDRPATELHDERKSHHEPNKNHHEPNKNHHEPNKNHHEPNKNHHEPGITYHEPNKNHHESIKKHPDEHKNHPDGRKSHLDDYNNHHNGNNHHNDGHHDNHNKSVANGHVPPSHHNNKREDSPLLSAHPVVPAGVGHKRNTPPSEHHNRTPPDHPKAPHHNSIKGTPPQKHHTPPKENNKNEKDRHPRAFDDYEIERRRQEMDRQGWPARDTKDYLIGGIYGPQPKSKLPNDAQPARQHHTSTNNNNNHHAGQRQESHPPAAVTRFPPAHNNNSYQPPSHAANRAQARKQKVAVKEPYRSRSYPRDDRNRLNNNNNNRKVPGQRNDPRSHSLMDLKGAPPHLPRSRNQSRAGNHLDQEHDSYLLDEDDEDYVLDPPERNGIKNAGRKGGKSRGFEGPVPTSELITSEATLNKAKVVHFFKNGDPFFPGVKVSIRPGRDFASFEALCNHLTPRTDLPIGVRYIFMMNGEKVKSLEELEDGGTYVCSSRKKYVSLPYGQGGLGWKPHSKFKMEEDLKLFRPPSPNGPAGNSSDGQTGSRGRKFIRVINNDDQSMQLRHMVNNRTTQPFENMIQGMAETLRMPHGKKLFSYSGKQIQSYSQLRNELREGDVFYLCTGESFGPTLLRKSETSRSFDEASMGHRQSKSFRRSNRPENETRDALPVVNRLQGGGNVGAVVGGGNPGRSRTRNTTKSNNSTSSTSPTLTHVDPVRMKIKGQRREVYPPLNQRYLRDESPPDKNLELNWVYGYRGHDTQLNLSLLPTGELLYFVAAVAVLYDRSKNRQRHYTGHNEDIQCLAVHPTRELVATGQKEGKGRHSRAQIHIWDIDNLSTQMIIGLNDVENGVIALSFSTKNLGQHLLIVDDGADHMISIWNWKSKRLLSKSPIHRQKVVGGRFIPKDDTMAVTYGDSHLTVWRRLKDGGFERDDLLDDDAKHVTCVEFDEEEEQYLITGDTDGNITLWSDGRTGVYQTVRVIQAHMRAVSAMMMLPDGTLLSSGGHEKDRYIKAWDSSHAFRAITFARLPESAGGVQSLCPSKYESPDLGIFAGTSKNMILEGSIHRRFKIVVQGHSRQLAALAIDPDEPAFVTAGFDRAISRWAMHKLVWKVQVQSECTGLAIHPLGEVVCVGTVDGHIIVLTLHRGMHVATLPATKQVITCLGYSPDGAHLAVALEEGGMILYNVSGRGYAYRRLKILRGVDQILHMDWAIDCKSIQSVTSDYNLIFWDMVSMEQEKIPSTLRDTKWHTLTCSLNYAVNGIWNNVNQLVDSVNTTCCASTSDKLLSVGDDEGHIRLFRYPCITPRADFHEYKAQSSKINSVRFLYDDSFLISIGGDDAVLMQWMVIHAK